MRARLVYVNSGPLPRGRAVSVRTEAGVDQSTVDAPSAEWIEGNPRMASCCAITDWIEVNDLAAIFERGEMTVNPDTGLLCDTPDTEIAERYAAKLAAESEVPRGDL